MAFNDEQRRGTGPRNSACGPWSRSGRHQQPEPPGTGRLPLAVVAAQRLDGGQQRAGRSSSTRAAVTLAITRVSRATRPLSRLSLQVGFFGERRCSSRAMEGGGRSQSSMRFGAATATRLEHSLTAAPRVLSKLPRVALRSERLRLRGAAEPAVTLSKTPTTCRRARGSADSTGRPLLSCNVGQVRAQQRPRLSMPKMLTSATKLVCRGRRGITTKAVTRRRRGGDVRVRVAQDDREQRSAGAGVGQQATENRERADHRAGAEQTVEDRAHATEGASRAIGDRRGQQREARGAQQVVHGAEQARHDAERSRRAGRADRRVAGGCGAKCSEAAAVEKATQTGDVTEGHGDRAQVAITISGGNTADRGRVDRGCGGAAPDVDVDQSQVEGKDAVPTRGRRRGRRRGVRPSRGVQEDTRSQRRDGVRWAERGCRERGAEARSRSVGVRPGGCGGTGVSGRAASGDLNSVVEKAQGQESAIGSHAIGKDEFVAGCRPWLCSG